MQNGLIIDTIGISLIRWTVPYSPYGLHTVPDLQDIKYDQSIFFFESI